jgi:hypothetical protein
MQYNKNIQSTIISRSKTKKKDFSLFHGDGKSSAGNLDFFLLPERRPLLKGFFRLHFRTSLPKIILPQPAFPFQSFLQFRENLLDKPIYIL